MIGLSKAFPFHVGLLEGIISVSSSIAISCGPPNKIMTVELEAVQPQDKDFQGEPL